jgi:hypothetical protein
MIMAMTLIMVPGMSGPHDGHDLRRIPFLAGLLGFTDGFGRNLIRPLTPLLRTWQNLVEGLARRILCFAPPRIPGQHHAEAVEQVSTYWQGLQMYPTVHPVIQEEFATETPPIWNLEGGYVVA